MVVFHVHEEQVFGADPLSSVPVRACFGGVKVLFTGYFEYFVRVWERAVAVYRLAAAASVRVVVIVLALAVGVAVVIVAGRPVQGYVVVGLGLSCGRQWGRRCGWRGAPSVGRGGGNAPVIVGFVSGSFGLFIPGTRP